MFTPIDPENISLPKVCLDRQPPTQKELDTIAVLQAIQKSKEARKPKKVYAANA